jgi:hypothetical protein
MLGGERGIRTLDTLWAYTRFPGVRLRPLGHLSVVAGRCPFRREARSIEQTFHKVKMPLPTSITAKHESDLKISYENPKHDDDKRREQPDMLIYHEPRRDEAGDLKDR